MDEFWILEAILMVPAPVFMVVHEVSTQFAINQMRIYARMPTQPKYSWTNVCDIVVWRKKSYFAKKEFLDIVVISAITARRWVQCLNDKIRSPVRPTVSAKSFVFNSTCLHTYRCVRHSHMLREAVPGKNEIHQLWDSPLIEMIQFSKRQKRRMDKSGQLVEHHILNLTGVGSCNKPDSCDRSRLLLQSTLNIFKFTS